MPAAEYRIRRDARQARRDELTWQHNRLADGRLAMVGLAVLLAWLAFSRHLVHPGWLAVPGILFLALAIVHDRVLMSRDRCRRAMAFYERGLARIEDRWAGTGSAGIAFLPEEHPYAADLDLFGRGSVFELLSTARLNAGERTLAGWLLAPAPAADITARQAAAQELRPRLDLREELALVGDEVSGWLDTSHLAAWGQAPALLAATWPRVVAFVLACANVIALVSALAYDTWAGWFALSGMLSIAFTMRWRRPVSQVIAVSNAPAHHLHLLAEVLAIVEREAAGSPRLQAIRSHVEVDGRPASRRIRELQTLVNLLESRSNQFFAPISALLLWGTQLAWAIETWRTRNGPLLAQWVAGVGEFEALTSLSSYAYEHPTDPFPTIVERGPLFDGEGLAHPLIASARGVANDVRLDTDTRVLVVSGSNMSGKSTLLRTVGVAAVLAQAGAPVRARRLAISPLAVGATLRVQDSLQAGKSRFFAEITRLRAIVDQTSGPLPVLFLLDELLAGTNSHDRRVGATSVVQGLVERGAIGLVTTHDLALAELASTLGVGAKNVHFSDTFEGGEIHFDYTMRPGVVQTSNALELMRAIGLIVE
jgi:MutS-like protein